MVQFEACVKKLFTVVIILYRSKLGCLLLIVNRTQFATRIVPHLQWCPENARLGWKGLSVTNIAA
jgi:hypothetical protein